MSQLLIHGGLCANSCDVFTADILVDEGRIVAIGEHLGDAAEKIVDARGKLVLPGGIDVHVHMPWPLGEFTSVDNFYHGTRTAALGGVTCVIDFVIPWDEQSLAEALENKFQDARATAWVDYSFHLNIRGDVQAKIREIPDLVHAGFPSFKIFMAYEGFRLADEDILRVMEAVRAANGMVNVHSENGPLADYLTGVLLEEGKHTLDNYPLARPGTCEIEANYRLLSYVERIGTRTHIHHVGTREGANLIAVSRRSGLPVSAETCPQYLLFSQEDYAIDPYLAAYLICAPSIKSKQDQSALWHHLADGSIQVLATDHCPYTRKQKELYLEQFSRIPGGMGGVGTRLPLIFTKGVLEGRVTLERFVDMWSTQPAKLFGLYPRKGTIAVGADADFVIFDPRQKTTIHAADLQMQSDCLPYEGWEVFGLPVTTLLRGKVIVEEGVVKSEEPSGQWISRSFEVIKRNLDWMKR